MDRIRELLPPHQVNLVVWHGRCTDGAAAAMCALLARGAEQVRLYESTRFFRDGERDLPLLDLVHADTCLVCVDYTYPRAFLCELHARVRALVVLDHHETARAALQDLPWCHFDLDESGATLAWRYFFGDQAPLPRLLQHVADRDLWRWRDPLSRAFCAAFYAEPVDPAHYCQWLERAPAPPTGSGNAYYRDCDDRYLDTLRRGEVVRAHVDAQVHQVVDDPQAWHRLRTADGRTMAVAEAGPYVSELGEALSARADVAALVSWDWSRRLDDQGTPAIRVSLRSAVDSVHDCAALARQVGHGGGHVHAAGFTWLGDMASLLARLERARVPTIVPPAPLSSSSLSHTHR